MLQLALDSEILALRKKKVWNAIQFWKHEIYIQCQINI